VDGAGDINGDGLADVVVGAPGYPYYGSTGRVYVVFGMPDADALNLETVAAGTGGFVIDSPGDDREIGSTVSGGGDVNGDGIPDVALTSKYIGEPPVYVVFGKSDGTAVALSDVAAGTGGFAVENPAPDPFLSSTVDVGGDLNGDGLAEVSFVGLPSFPTQGAPRVYVVFGNTTGANVIPSDIEAGDGGVVLVGEVDDIDGGSFNTCGDINGDGIGDMVIGEIGSDAFDSYTGRGYVVFGADFLGTTTGLGSPDDDLIFANLGASAADFLLGEHGADSLFSDGGADVLLGGSGDDIITIVDAQFRRIDGGSGGDTVAFGAVDLALDLTAINGWRLTSIETFDLSGNGDNTITLTVPVVSALSPSHTEITVIGETGDELILDVSAATPTSAGGFTTHAFTNVSVKVSDDVTVSAPP